VIVGKGVCPFHSPIQVVRDVFKESLAVPESEMAKDLVDAGNVQ
jgi:hypothetical protein